MKWSPQPKDPCARKDCDRPTRQWGFCGTHSALWRLHGVPYTLAEQEDMRVAEEIQQEMDALLDASPPVIRWEPRRHGVLVGTVLDDPHADHPNPRKTA